jgi:hypothetical protein
VFNFTHDRFEFLNKQGPGLNDRRFQRIGLIVV